MKKVTAIVGAESRKATYQAVQEFEKNLKRYGDVDFEYVFLSDYHLEFCKGCKACFLKGEEYCPSKDDRDVLIEKIEQSDGVIFATPNYAFQVSARMKNFLDRLAFMYHRPRFFGKTLTVVVAQGFFGGGSILRYLSSAGKNLGFTVSKGCCLTTLDPMTERQEKELIRKVKKASERFYRQLMCPMSSPSLFRLMIFRMSRTQVKTLNENYMDYRHYKEKGWLESDYFYPTTMGIMKRLAGKSFDFMARQLVKWQ